MMGGWLDDAGALSDLERHLSRYGRWMSIRNALLFFCAIGLAGGLWNPVSALGAALLAASGLGIDAALRRRWRIPVARLAALGGAPHTDVGRWLRCHENALRMRRWSGPAGDSLDEAIVCLREGVGRAFEFGWTPSNPEETDAVARALVFAAAEYGARADDPHRLVDWLVALLLVRGCPVRPDVASAVEVLAASARTQRLRTAALAKKNGIHSGGNPPSDPV